MGTYLCQYTEINVMPTWFCGIEGDEECGESYNISWESDELIVEFGLIYEENELCWCACVIQKRPNFEVTKQGIFTLDSIWEDSMIEYIELIKEKFVGHVREETI